MYSKLLCVLKESAGSGNYTDKTINISGIGENFSLEDIIHEIESESNIGKTIADRILKKTIDLLYKGD